MLKEIEDLRKELVEKIIKITGLSIDEITVDISFSPESENELAIEARELNWRSDKYKESAWYTSEIPQGGSTTVFVE